MPETCTCGGEIRWSKFCGAKVCTNCDNHAGLARCYCGWSANGGNGRQQLEELGETIDPEPSIGGFLGDSEVFDEPGVEEAFPDEPIDFLSDAEADADVPQRGRAPTTTMGAAAVSTWAERDNLPSASGGKERGVTNERIEPCPSNISPAAEPSSRARRTPARSDS
jgi:hypothetical protein